MSRGYPSSTPPGALSDATLAALEQAAEDHPDEPLAHLLRVALEAYQTERRARLHALGNIAQVEAFGRRLYAELETERSMCDVYRNEAARLKTVAEEHRARVAQARAAANDEGKK